MVGRVRVPRRVDQLAAEALLALELREERVVVHAVRKDHVPTVLNTPTSGREGGIVQRVQSTA